MSQVIAAVVSVLLILGLGSLIWFKIKNQPADVALEKRAADLTQAKEAVEKALAQKDLQERQELDAKVETIKQAGDVRAALELLAKLRGVH